MSKNRDTQFKGFAKAVVLEMLDQRQYGWIDFNVADLEEIEEYSTIIARLVYDLVGYTIESIEHIDLDRLSTDEHIKRIPDLTELSNQAE